MQQSGGYAPPLVMEDFEVHWLGKPPSGTMFADIPAPEAATPGPTPGLSPADSQPLETSSVPAHKPRPQIS